MLVLEQQPCCSFFSYLRPIIIPLFSFNLKSYNKPMRILYVITSGDIGGAQKYVLDLAKYFSGTIAVGKENPELIDKARHNNTSTIPLNHLKRNIHPWHDALAVWELFKVFKQEQPDIVHLNSSKAGFIGSLAAWFAHIPIVYTAHGFVFNEPLAYPVKILWVLLEKFASLFRKKVICVSEADRQSALRHHIANAQKLVTIHNGIEPINFLTKSEARHKLNLSDDKIHIGSIANFYATKGIDILIDSVKALSIDIQNKVQVLLIGDGPLKQQYKAQVHRLGLENTIIFLGNIPHAAAHLKAFDIFVLPSRKEGFPYVILEAMQARLPVIASQVGGVPEALGHAGLLVKSASPFALAAAISELITNDKLRNELGNLTVARSQKFTIQKMLQDTERVYRTCITKSNL
jgi:glycosyltransferase involved in cell wall biosynthesis